MQEYVTVKVPQELLPQVVGELLAFTYNPDYVEVVHGPEGQEILVHPAIADAWFLKHNPPEPAPTPAPEPVPPVEAPVAVMPPPAPPAAAPPAPKPSTTRKTTSA